MVTEDPDPRSGCRGFQPCCSPGQCFLSQIKTRQTLKLTFKCFGICFPARTQTYISFSSPVVSAVSKLSYKICKACKNFTLAWSPFIEFVEFYKWGDCSFFVCPRLYVRCLLTQNCKIKFKKKKDKIDFPASRRGLCVGPNVLSSFL